MARDFGRAILFLFRTNIYKNSGIAPKMTILGFLYYSTYIKFRGEISSFRQGVWQSILTGGVRLDSVSPLQTYLTSSTGSFGLENLLSQYDHHTIRGWRWKTILGIITIRGLEYLH